MLSDGKVVLLSRVVALFPAILRKILTLDSKGGGGEGIKALMAWPLVEELFFAAFPSINRRAYWWKP